MGTRMGSIAHSIPLNNLGPIIFINHILTTSFQNNTLLTLQNFTQAIGHKYDCQHDIHVPNVCLMVATVYDAGLTIK